MGKKIIWREQARLQLRAIDRATAMRILHALALYLETGEGDVKRLQNIEPPEFRPALVNTDCVSICTETLSASPP